MGDCLLTHQQGSSLLLPVPAIHFVDKREDVSTFLLPRLQKVNAHDWLVFSCASFLRSSWQAFGFLKLWHL